MDLSSNFLTGTIPNLSRNLIHLALYDNMLSKSIPSNLFQLDKLRLLYLGGNLLTSSIPSEIGNLYNLNALYIDNNQLSSSLPNELLNLTNLVNISFANNSLTGIIKFQIQNFPDLIFLNFSSNLFIGSISNIWNSSITSSVEVIDFSFNKFTGIIPSVLFTSNTNLTNVNLMSNCFHGSLPSSICKLEKLKYLLLDLASSGEQCDHINLGFILMFIKKPQPKQHLIGDIPNCIWSMQNLVIFHAAGNKLEGPLGELIDTSQLENINLANNHLTGSFPVSWQTHSKFNNLGLGNNRLNGVLISNISISNNVSSLKLNLANNRLSGSISNSLLSLIGLEDDTSLVNIKIIDGNLFNCNQSISLSIYLHYKYFILTFINISLFNN
jgi:hypothetical protein